MVVVLGVLVVEVEVVVLIVVVVLVILGGGVACPLQALKPGELLNGNRTVKAKPEAALLGFTVFTE